MYLNTYIIDHHSHHHSRLKEVLDFISLTYEYPSTPSEWLNWFALVLCTVISAIHPRDLFLCSLIIMQNVLPCRRWKIDRDWSHKLKIKTQKWLWDQLFITQICYVIFDKCQLMYKDSYRHPDILPLFNLWNNFRRWNSGDGSCIKMFTSSDLEILFGIQNNGT